MEMLGRLLVAPPAQDDDFWSKSVCLIYEYNKGSHVGLVLNKPSERSVAEIALHHGIIYEGNEMLYLGGPVNPAALLMLHSGEWTCTNTMHVMGNLRVSSDKTMLKRVCSGDAPKHWRMFLGMSAWSPGQLEGEISGDAPWSKKNAWLAANGSENVIFQKDPDKMWKKSIDLAVQQITDSYFAID
jgi:putative transcriptional regulator